MPSHYADESLDRRYRPNNAQKTVYQPLALFGKFTNWQTSSGLSVALQTHPGLCSKFMRKFFNGKLVTPSCPGTAMPSDSEFAERVPVKSAD